MSVSMPSREAYVIDIPEITDLRCEFTYNYFVPDEGAIDSGGIDNNLLSISSEDLTLSYVKSLNNKPPRYVRLTWTPPGRVSSKKTERGLISQNILKIVSESDASTYEYVTITFNDLGHDAKLATLISGSMLQSTTDQINQGSYEAANTFVKKLPDHIDGAKIIDALTQPKNAYGGRFFTREGFQFGKKQSLPPSLTMSVNAKFAADIFKRSTNDPMSQNGTELGALQHGLETLSSIVIKRANNGKNDAQNNLIVRPISVKAANDATNETLAEVVGYIIEKYEHSSTGEVSLCDQIIIENSQVCETIDLRVKYGATYSYVIKTISRLKMFGFDAFTKKPAIITFLASSKSSNRSLIECIEFVAPPWPDDIQPIWNHEDEKLMICWQHPVNSQRDIKGFQVFRRENINHPFELIRDIRFNNALVKSNRTIHVVEDKIDASLVENRKTATTTFIDVEFTKRSKYIYAVCSVDAHGLISNYSPQIQVSFDAFKNRLILTHVCCSGAPKAYPNMFLRTDAFVDTMRTRGGSNRVLKLFLTPETYAINNKQSNTKIVRTKQQNSRYVLQAINLDSETSSSVTITLDDRRPKIEDFRFNTEKRRLTLKDK